MKKLSHAVLVFAGCLHFFGGNLGVVQVIAWAEMIIDYSEENGLSEGLRMTFNGKNPCERCHAIAAAKKDQPQEPDAPGDPNRDRLRVEIPSCPEWRGGSLRPPRARIVQGLNFPEPSALSAHGREAPASPPPQFA